VEIQKLNDFLIKQLDKDVLDQKYVKTGDILKLVGAGLFLATSLVVPNLPKILKPLFNPSEKESWKRFNLPYLKRTLQRLEKQKLIEISENNGQEIVKVTEMGKVKILKFSVESLSISKPSVWDGYWRIVLYDIPKSYPWKRQRFREYLKLWMFYPLQESVYLHAYPCEQQVEFLKDYLGISEFVRTIKAINIENDEFFRNYFDI